MPVDENHFRKYKTRSGKTRFRAECKDCESLRSSVYREEHGKQIAKRMKRWKSANRKRLNEYGRKYYSDHQDGFRVNARQRSMNVKRLVIDHYGGRCNCCGEDRLAFLTIDHVDGRGNKHRDSVGRGNGRDFYHWLIQNDFPSGFQVLCFNCNCGRSVNGGVCPHAQSDLMEYVI